MSCDLFKAMGIPQYNVKEFLATYRAFSNGIARQAFLDFCKPYLRDGFGLYSIEQFLPIYQRFSDDMARQEFSSFCKPYVNKDHTSADVMGKLLIIYQAFSDCRTRQEFLEFCKPYLSKDYSSVMKKLLIIYQAFSDCRTRQEFLEFCKPYLIKALYTQSMDEPTKFLMEALLSIYQNPQRKRNFLSFIQPYVFLDYKVDFHLYSSRAYLELERSLASLEANLDKKVAVKDEIEEDNELLLEIDMEIPAIQEAFKIFSVITKEEQGATGELRRRHQAARTEPEPELFERYRACYSDFYKRIPIFEANGSFLRYNKDEHTLERDGIGNMVSQYADASGTLRTNAEGQPCHFIIYSKDEFKVLETAFSYLMKKEFEDHRGLKY